MSGIDSFTRFLLRLGPLLWTATLFAVTITIAITLERLRTRDRTRSASRPMLTAAIALAIGSTAGQLATSIGLTRVGHITWDNKAGLDSLTALPSQLFDFTPLAVAVSFLAITLLIRRTETPVPA